MDLNLLLSTFLILFAAYLLASMAGLISEKSGTVNISIEGTMIMGATLYVLMMNGLGAGWASMEMWGVIFSTLIAGLGGVMFGALLGMATSFFKADNIIAGTALNLLAPVIFLIVRFGVTGGDFIINTPPIWTIYEYFPYIMAGSALTLSIITWVVLNKTSTGLRLRTAGENPYSLETTGISTNVTRFLVLLVAGFLAGASGAVIRMNQFGGFVGTVYGAGFIAIGIVIFGQWKVLGSVIGSALIGIVLAFVQVATGAWEIVEQYRDLFLIIPFVIPLLTLMLFKKVSSPSAVGKPFSKSTRT